MSSQGTIQDFLWCQEAGRRTQDKYRLMALNSVQQASMIISCLLKGQKRLDVNKNLWVCYRNEGQWSFPCPAQPGDRTFHGLLTQADAACVIIRARPSPPCLLDRWADLLIRLIPGGPGWSPAGTNKRLLAPVSVGHLQCFASPFDLEPHAGATSGPFLTSAISSTPTLWHTHDQTQNAVYYPPEVHEMDSHTF